MTLREKAIKQLSKSIPIEPNAYTETRIQKLIKLWKNKRCTCVDYVSRCSSKNCTNK